MIENWTEIGFAGLAAGILWMTYKWMTNELNKKIDDLHDIIIKLINDLKNPFVKLCPSNINTDNILNLVDGVITGRGTIGLEAAIKGKKTLIAGKNENRNFVNLDEKLKTTSS